MRRLRYLILICSLVLLSLLSLAAPKYFYGKSSWYGGRFHGRKTASGEIFDQNKLTAAHRTLPFGTVLKVTNLTNNLSVQVKI
ncbi:MAG: septal ring lytic transglycosylase RlpA family lipoprotein, partial [Spirochaetae bacterium HGW-Spirochaetae-6]